MIAPERTLSVFSSPSYFIAHGFERLIREKNQIWDTPILRFEALSGLGKFICIFWIKKDEVGIETNELK